MSSVRGCEQAPPAPSCVQVAAARAALPEHIRVVPLPQDDAWFRDTGPTVSAACRLCCLLLCCVAVLAVLAVLASVQHWALLPCELLPW